jgi:hypothetical protein
MDVTVLQVTALQLQRLEVVPHIQHRELILGQYLQVSVKFLLLLLALEEVQQEVYNFIVVIMEYTLMLVAAVAVELL